MINIVDVFEVIAEANLKKVEEKNPKKENKNSGWDNLLNTIAKKIEADETPPAEYLEKGSVLLTAIISKMGPSKYISEETINEAKKVTGEKITAEQPTEPTEVPEVAEEQQNVIGVPEIVDTLLVMIEKENITSFDEFENFIHEKRLKLEKMGKLVGIKDIPSTRKFLKENPEMLQEQFEKVVAECLTLQKKNEND